MAVLSGKDIYSSKYMTADITDSSNRVFYVPIKYVLGDYFLAKIENQLYCFKLDGSRICTYRHTLAKSFRKVYYNTEHYMPLSPGDVKNLEDILTKNDLPKVDNNMLKTFKILSKKETKDFQGHDIPKLIEEIATHEKDYPQEVQDMKRYLEQLGTEKIVTPVKQLSEFLDIELNEADPKFMGSVVNAVISVEEQHKKITNTPQTGKKPFMTIIIIVALVAIVGGVIYYGASSGTFSHLIPQIGGPPPTSANDIMKQYPDPAILKAKIDRGEAKLSDYPPEVQDMIKNTKLPTTPLPAAK